MSGVATAVVAGNVIGGMISGNAAENAASTSAGAQLESARISADAAKFRPVGVTTNYGTSNFGFNPNTGYLESAGYTLTPEMQDLQRRLIGGYGGLLSQAQGVNTDYLNRGAQSLFGLGQQYLATSPEQASQDWLTNQRNLLAPQQEQDLANIRNKLYQSGRTGLATGGTTAGGLQATNPEMAAYYNAKAATERDLAAKADQYGLARTQAGQGLLTGGANLLETGYGLQSKAYSPLMTSLGLGTTIEQLGQSPLDIGAQLGGRSATAGANVGQSLLYGGLSAAKTAQAGNQYSPLGTALTGVANSPYLSQWFNRQISSPFGGTPQGGYATQGQYLSGINGAGGTAQQNALWEQGGADFLSW